jgi:hypothetical protein
MVIDWVFQNIRSFKLLPETKFLAIQCFDRFLSKKPINRQKLQALLIACFMIAGKLEEVYPPDLEDWIRLTAVETTTAELVKFEEIVLNTLNWKLNFPTSFTFFKAIADEIGLSKEDSQWKSGYKYLEVSVMLYSLLEYKPSDIAIACLILGTTNDEELYLRLKNYLIDNKLQINTEIIETIEERYPRIVNKYKYFKE